MNCAPRRTHRLAWLVIVPLAVVVLYCAYQQRPAQQTPRLEQEEGR